MDADFGERVEQREQVALLVLVAGPEQDLQWDPARLDYDVEAAAGRAPERAEAIAEWFSDEANRALVAELRSLGLRFEIGDELKPVEGPLTGDTYVITGTLEGYTRDEAAAELEAKGAKVLSSVSGKTTGLIVGEEPGNSKLTKARKVEVPILSEPDLVKLLKRA